MIIRRSILLAQRVSSRLPLVDMYTTIALRRSLPPMTRRSFSSEESRQKNIPLHNEQITFSSMRVVYKDPTTQKSNWAILNRKQALELAKKQDLDLVLMNADADPPVCKLEDLSKMLMAAKKREKQMRMSQKATSTKEMLMSVGIDPHDFKIKMKKVIEFLEEGHPVRLSVVTKRRKADILKTEQHIQKFKDKGTNLPMVDIDEITLKVYETLETLPVVVQQKDHSMEVEQAVQLQTPRDKARTHSRPELEKVLVNLHTKRDFMLTPKALAKTLKKPLDEKREETSGDQKQSIR